MWQLVVENGTSAVGSVPQGQSIYAFVPPRLTVEARAVIELTKFETPKLLQRIEAESIDTSVALLHRIMTILFNQQHDLMQPS